MERLRHEEAQYVPRSRVSSHFSIWSFTMGGGCSDATAHPLLMSPPLLKLIPPQAVASHWGGCLAAPSSLWALVMLFRGQS